MHKFFMGTQQKPAQQITIEESMPTSYMSAAGLIKVFRASDYTFNTAVLEGTDNSNDAQAKSIIVKIVGRGNPAIIERVEILDDGTGMSLTQLAQSFVLGTKSKAREEHDIGMYHVGMKFGTLNGVM
jgi:hypothetical protein